MKTRLLDPVKDPDALAQAAALLRAGEVVGMPTETVYGLAANALDGAAVAKIFEAKGRPQDNPLIVHIADKEQIHTLARTVPESAQKLAEAFWPGPLTIILPRADCIPHEVSAGLDTVGIRLPVASDCACAHPRSGRAARCTLGKHLGATVYDDLGTCHGGLKRKDSGDC